MDYKPTYKKQRVTNKDKLRTKKYNKKYKHSKQVKVKLNKLEKRKEKEKYMRKERQYWDHFVKNSLPHNYMYKLKDSVSDWIENDELFDDMTDSIFWSWMCTNPHAIFMLFDRKHIRYFIEHFWNCGMIMNKNADSICEMIVIEMLKNVEDYECLHLWRYICRHGGPRIVRLLEENVDKYREKYGIYYMNLYQDLTANPDAMYLIKKYYDTMFDNSCYCYILSNTHPEAVDIVEKIYEDIDEYTIIYQTESIMKNSDVRIIKRLLTTNNRPYIVYHLMENENAIDIIKEVMETPRYHHYIDWNLLNRNKNAIHMLMDYPENISYYDLCSNENGIHLLESYLQKIMADELDDSHFLRQFFYEEKPYDINSYALCSNTKAFHLVEKYPQFLATNILENPQIFAINYDYLRRKWDYVTHEEESRMIQYMKKEITHIEPRLLKKLHTDYISQAEIEKVVNEYAEKDKYLPEHELIFRISYERLIRAVYSPRRVLYNLTKYNYDIHEETYCDDAS